VIAPPLWRRFWSRTTALSKLVAFREKDFASAGAMLQSGLIDPTILARRIDRLPTSLDPQVQKKAAYMVEGLSRTPGLHPGRIGWKWVSTGV